MLHINSEGNLTGIWDRGCWPQKAGIFDLIFSQKMGINILGWTDMDETPPYLN